MTQDTTQWVVARRANYLARAMELRDMAERAYSPEAQEALARLGVMYEELAEFTAQPGSADPTNSVR